MSTESVPVDASPDDDQHFEKQVDVVEKNEEEQIARGAILVDSELDHQGDFIREETIRDAAESYAQRFEEGDALPGVMHSVFPSGDKELVESRVLDEPETIGGETFGRGTWIQAYKYHDDELWSLVSDEILNGFSIGGTAKGTVYEPGALPDDVRIPEAVQSELDDADLSREDIAAREITQARILEVSSVDAPAVPRAVHAETKSLQKASPALTENVVVARLYLEERGLDPNDARRLAEYLQSRKAADTGDSGGLVSRAKSWFSKGRTDAGDAPAPAVDDAADAAEKAGRTLSQANVESAKAVHDAALDMLDRSDVDHGRVQFSDDPNDAFAIGDYGRQTGDGSARAGVPADATEAATDADGDTISAMSDDELAETLEALTDQVGSVTERLDTIEAQLEADGGAAEDTTGATTDSDETETAKTDGGADAAAMPDAVEAKFGEMAEAITQVAENQSQQADALEQQGEVLERMASAQGVSQQATDGTRSNGSTDKLWGNNSPFAPNRGGR